ncbi:MAG: ABC transporter ATP-binding protein [Rhizobiaceae bacterium]
MSVVLSLSNIHKNFGGLSVINDVSFEIVEGSRTALIGPNGAGKTTVFNLLSGIYPLDRGQIILNGIDISAVPPRKRIDYGISRSFQNIRLMPHLSTVENVILGQHHLASAADQLFRPLKLFNKSRDFKRAEQALENAGLGTYPGQNVKELPYGVQKRIEVVRALMSNPKLLLLDEPAAGLNSVESRELRKMLEKVSETGVTLLIVEHDMNFVRKLTDHVIVLNFGKKIFEGTPEQVGKDRNVLEAYLGTDQTSQNT